MEEIIVSDGAEKSSYITYLYHAIMNMAGALGGRGELAFGDERALFRVSIDTYAEELRANLREKISEVIGIGYKYKFLERKLQAALSSREKKLLCGALISADLEGDKAYIRSKLERSEKFVMDGFYHFRLTALREKWEKIVAYIPTDFSSVDLKKFISFLVGESRRKIYVKGNGVYAENFAPLHRSRLLGEEDAELEIILADAGFVYCVGEVENGVGDFLQKYYAERAVFS